MDQAQLRKNIISDAYAAYMNTSISDEQLTLLIKAFILTVEVLDIIDPRSINTNAIRQRLEHLLQLQDLRKPKG